MDVKVNETQLNLPPDIGTWGEALDWIEMEHLRAGQCITHVFFDGHEELNYRRSAVCDQHIDDVGVVRVKSGNFERVVAESLAELDVEVQNAIDTTREIIRLFENREERKGYYQLSILLDSIRLFYSVFTEDLGWSDVTDLEISRERFTP